MSGAIIEAEGLGMRFATGRLALDGASLAVRPGELAVILGANGSGKSTMLRIIAGIIKPTMLGAGRRAGVALLPARFRRISATAPTRLRDGRYRPVRHRRRDYPRLSARRARRPQHHPRPPRLSPLARHHGLCRAVPDLIWALLFVTAVGLEPFPGALAISVHSIGMLGRLLAEVIEDMDMGSMEALSTTGAGRLQIFSHAVVPTVLPSLLGISLYRFDENIRSSLILGFVGAGGIGFQLLTAMNLFQYKTVSLLLIMMFALVITAERASALLRKRLA